MLPVYRSHSVPSKSTHPFELHEVAFQRFLESKRCGSEMFALNSSLAAQAISDLLTSTASRILRSPEFCGLQCDPREAAQAWFVQFLKLPTNTFPLDRPIFPYAYVMLIRICVTMARRAKVRRTRAWLVEPADCGLTPCAAAVKREKRRVVLSALAQLDAEEQWLILDRYWRLSGEKRTGKRLGLRPSVVHGRLHRARKKLRDLLSRDLID